MERGLRLQTSRTSTCASFRSVCIASLLPPLMGFILSSYSATCWFSYTLIPLTCGIVILLCTICGFNVHYYYIYYLHMFHPGTQTVTERIDATTPKVHRRVWIMGFRALCWVPGIWSSHGLGLDNSGCRVWNLVANGIHTGFRDLICFRN